MFKTKSYRNSTCSFCLPRKPRQSSSCTFTTVKGPSNLKEWRSTLEHFATRNKLSSSDWYQIQSTTLDEKAQKIIKKEFNGSIYRALCTVFPETDWLPWKFAHHNVPVGFWKEQSNQRKYFDDLGIHHGIQTLDDWYDKLSQKLLEENGGRSLLYLYKNSPVNAIMAAYPEHNWIPWKFENVPNGYWKSMENQRKFFDWLGNELGVKQMDDWYEKLSGIAMKQAGGRSLYIYYNGSPISALMAVYPEHNWIPWQFNSISKGYWRDHSNQKKVFEEYGKELGVQSLDDWYDKLTPATLSHPGMQRLLGVYKGSVIQALKTLYPEHNWMEWKFSRVSRGFWGSKDNIGAFLAELSQKLAIQKLDDWYRVDLKQLHRLGAGALVTKSKTLYNLLKEQYPHHPWDRNRFKQTKKSQRWLAVTLKKIFPHEEILEDYAHPKSTRAYARPVQLDIFIPSRSLAFEYQGEQHYEDVGIFAPSIVYQKRDEEKRALCAANNIKLIEVPYWWNRTEEALQEIIHKSGIAMRST